MENEIFELENIFFEDINEWDRFCDDIDLTK